MCPLFGKINEKEAVVWPKILFFCKQVFIFIEMYMLQYVNTLYYPFPPKTDG